MKNYSVYIMANRSKRIYTGVTNDLIRRVEEHRTKADRNSFTSMYNITQLVYFEQHNSVEDAISREKQIKGWLRKKKIALIESSNPIWKDLAGELS